jgi:hypothetical protein
VPITALNLQIDSKTIIGRLESQNIDAFNSIQRLTAAHGDTLNHFSSNRSRVKE